MELKIFTKIQILTIFGHHFDEFLAFRQKGTFTSMGTIFDNLTEVVRTLNS